ncbi:hypothetical protein SLS56_000895 [Neofusicoccum ribis]|uniref:Transcription factor domain-containing protein n=1 Tax=Neofusicoccum ribis TaxID=45134 RepID=A0ABR3TBQ7_9PEZI
MSHLALDSLQACLILTINDCGAGTLCEFWNLVALAKRISTQLGLRDLVVNKCANFNQLSSIPPRMLPLPSTLVSQEENVRTYWMTEVLDSSSTLGVAWNLSLPRPIENALLPCNNAVWSFPEAAMGMWSFDDLEFSSSYSLYVSLFTNELWHVHNFLQQSYDMRSAEDRPQAQVDCQAVDSRLLQWKAGSGSIAFPSENTLLGRGSFDPNILTTRCMFNAAIILMYQRLTIPPKGLEHVFEPWYHAIQRCIDSANDITAAIRSVDDFDLETTNPQLTLCIFVAARFLIDRQEKVIRTALAEYKIPLSISSLPAQFFDLQYSALDIDEALRGG